MPHLPCDSRNFFAEIVKYAQQKSILNGRALHALIIRTSKSSCIFLANALVNFYGKCGHLHRAKLVFENIQNKDVVSWNSLINGYSQQGHTGSSSVTELFQRMIAENIFPNAHTFAGVFTAASCLSDAFAGQQAHTLVIKTANFEDVFVGSSLVNMYCKVGLVGEALKVFDRMPERNSFSWTTMISGYAKQQMAVEALGIFNLMRREYGREDEFVFTSVLSGLVAPEVVDSGKQLHCLAVKNGLLMIVSVANALVTMYVKCGSLDDALRTFEFSGDKDYITWSAMITGYAQSGDSYKALKLFSNMHFIGIKPNEYTIVGVLNACSDLVDLEVGKQVHDYLLKLGFESQIFILTALVDVYSKCGSTVDARKGFDCIQEPDIVLWTSMIGGYVQNGEYEEALSLYGRMHARGFFPNELTIASVLKACSSLAALETGKQVHVHTVKYGFSLDVSIGSSLSTLYAKCGSLEEGNLVFRRMPVRDVVSWNAMISGLSHNGCGNDALDLFEEMLVEGPKPDYVTFVNLLSACSHMGSVEKGWSYFKMMFDDFRIVPRVEHYACMVDILSRAGKLNEAKELIESATINHGMCLWHILLSACRNYRNYELGAYAGEKLVKMGSKESAVYVLLSGIYTALGRSEDVEWVMRMMKLQGVSKEPGCSWIELNSQVHVFVVGDQMHPLIGDIQTEIRKLSKQMKDEGYKPSPGLASATFGG